MKSFMPVSVNYSVIQHVDKLTPDVDRKSARQPAKPPLAANIAPLKIFNVGLDVFLHGVHLLHGVDAGLVKLLKDPGEVVLHQAVVVVLDLFRGYEGKPLQCLEKFLSQVQLGLPGDEVVVGPQLLPEVPGEMHVAPRVKDVPVKKQF